MKQTHAPCPTARLLSVPGPCPQKESWKETEEDHFHLPTAYPEMARRSTRQTQQEREGKDRCGIRPPH